MVDTATDAGDSPATEGPHSYQVLARRYRPRTFDELVGQQPIAQALRNAILSQRVGHAYLFTGARGVGKTSTARIFAKALNCVRGPTPQPDNTCDICRGIDVGEDVDVLEIDGASNRGIEEIRQLRSAIHTRPARARYKIYIIDEVHMLTTPAFNALLKTLEEPPDHVKFIFCTTDPEKIPITVLSRCQRYDFAPLEPQVIRQRLVEIAEREGRRVDAEVLDQLARRAGGSMRDSQSLFEQLLAFAGEHITTEDLHILLGTADCSSLHALAELLLERKADESLRKLDQLFRRGTDPAHLLEQLLAFFRDMLVAGVGGDAPLAMIADSTQWQELAQRGRQVGMESLLAIAQILDHSLVRMRQSTQGRLLCELAVLRICLLPNLDDLAALVAQLKQAAATELAPRSSPPTQRDASAPSVDNVVRAPGGGEELGRPQAGSHEPRQKKTFAPPAEQASGDGNGGGTSLQVPHRVDERGTGFAGQDASDADRLETSHPAEQFADGKSLWEQAARQVGGLGQQMMLMAEKVMWQADGQLLVEFPANGAMACRWCQHQDRRQLIGRILHELLGRPIQLVTRYQPPAEAALEAVAPRPPRSPLQTASQHPLVRKAMELFDGELLRVQGVGNARSP